MPSQLISTSIVFSIVLILLQFIQNDLLFLRENIQQGELWRIWTGNLIHSNYTHLGLNLSGFWLFVFIFKELINAIQLMLSLAILISGVGLGLYFLNPELYWYAGLSGALYGLFIVGAFYALVDKDFITGVSIIIVIPVKIIWDHLHNTGQLNADLIGVPVSTDSHIYGISTAFFIGIYVLYQHISNQTK
ncbi:MAG TPA: rhombosortase [Leucothrix mucor]|uniref:Rhombosortase n=1 Tax=Leucothrix mucor TaxID=45248 RepID=A0A7V2T0H8_LEUMU|nr:rhombosortase [Leucothrix mucor]